MTLCVEMIILAVVSFIAYTCGYRKGRDDERNLRRWAS